MTRILFILTLISMILFPLETKAPVQPTIVQCFLNTESREMLRTCYNIFLTAEEYDLYLRRFDELLWKYEAY